MKNLLLTSPLAGASLLTNLSAAIALSVALLWSSPSAHAALIAYEGFDITSGSINGLAGTGGGTATWTSGTWNNTDNVWSAKATGLSYSNLVTTPGGGFSSGPGNQQTFRQLGAQSATGTYWLGYLFNRTTGGGGDSLGLSFYDGASESTFVGQAGNSNFGFNAPFGNFTSTEPIVSGNTVFLLARYVMDGNTSGQTSTAHYWINPNISSQPSDASAVNGTGGTLFRAFSLSQIRLGSFGSQGDFDEIRIGTTFADVSPIPEPSTVALLGLGALGLLAMRRRFTRD